MSQKSPLVTIFITVLIDLLGVGIVIPVIAPLLLQSEHNLLASSMDLDTRTIVLGFLIASFPIAQFFGAPILGSLSDRHGRKKVLALSLVGTAAGYVLFAYAIISQNIFILFLSRALDGFTGGNIAIAYSAISDSSDQESKARNFGMVSAAFGIGFILGPFIGGKLADPSIVSWFNMATPFWFAAIISTINLLFVLFAFPETLKNKKQSTISLLTGIRNIKQAFELKHLQVLFLVVLLHSIGFNFFTQFFQVFLIGKFDFGVSQIADLFAFIGIWIILAQGGLQRPLSKMFVPYKIIRVSSLLLALVMPMLLVPNNPKYLYYIVPLIAIFQGLTLPNLTTLVSNQAGKDSQGQILGINQSIQSLGTALPPIIASYINNVNISLPISSSAICIFLSWTILIVFFKRIKEQSKHINQT